MLICEHCGGQRVRGCVIHPAYANNYSSGVLFTSDGTVPSCTCEALLVSCVETQVIPISEGWLHKKKKGKKKDGKKGKGGKGAQK